MSSIKSLRCVGSVDGWVACWLKLTEAGIAAALMEEVSLFAFIRDIPNLSRSSSS